ncbi:MAG: AAA family ATPase [Anaerolineae bacterium]|nr:AAA family ATPase [Anaerolineae bacterium]
MYSYFSIQCPNCGFDSPAVMQFCGMCGTQLTQVCQHCGFANPLNFLFCGMCGRRLREASSEISGSETKTQEARSGKLETKVEKQEVRSEDQELQPASSFPLSRSTTSTSHLPFPAALTPSHPRLPAPVSATPAPLQGQRRVATIILTDVRNSTDLVEQIGTESWVEVMSHLFRLLEAEIYRFGGVVDQFRGDGLVAFFGTREAHEDDPERAVLAGLAIQKAIRPYATELATRDNIDLKLRVGINTGEVIVTSVGDSRQYQENTAMGEAIAIAARMETAAEPGTVLVSENTYNLVPDRFEWQPLGEIRVKGISYPISVYRPLAHRTDAEHVQTFGFPVPLIGRDAEFQTLLACVKDLYDGRGGITMLIGERGLGKSYLVAEVRQHIVRQGVLLSTLNTGKYMLTEEADNAPSGNDVPVVEITWLRGRCRSYDQLLPYAMWLDLLENWLDVQPQDPPEEIRDHLRRQSERLWGTEMANHYPILATFFSLPLETEFTTGSYFAGNIEDLSGEEWQRLFFQTICSWVEKLSQQGPLVLAFSNVHWADSASLALLKHCLPLCDRHPVLWLLVFRPDRMALVWELNHYIATEYPHRLTAIDLPPFTKAQSKDFIHRLIGSETLSEENCALIVEKSEGNPYFIQELVRVLLTQSDTNDIALGLPDSLQSLVLARIDNLSPEQRHILQLAAVIGPVFWCNVLKALSEDNQITTHLNALQRAQLIHERRRVPHLGMEYAFNSSLIRDVVYESLLNTQRNAYHLRIAEYMEALIETEGSPQFNGLLAYHYHRAGRQGRELHHILRAAEQARKIYANVEALEHYTHALEVLNGIQLQTDEERHSALTQRFHILSERRGLYFLTGNFNAAWEDARALLPLAEQLTDEPALMIDALLHQPGVQTWQHRTELLEGAHLAEQALALARQIGDRPREMACLGAIAAHRYTLNDPSWYDVGEQALQLARELGDRRFEVGMLTGIGRVYASSDPARSMEYLQIALPICQTLDDQQAELDLLDLIGVQLESSSDYYKRLKECHEKQVEISRAIGNRPAEVNALMFCGQIQGLYLGDYEGGLALLNESMRLWEDIPGKMYALLRIAQIQVMLGQYDAAAEILAHARDDNPNDLYDLGTAGLHLVCAILCNAIGDEEHLYKVLDLTARVHKDIVENKQLSEHYQMVATCEEVAAHLGLALWAVEEDVREAHQRLALETSQLALEMYETYGFVRPIECVSEEILFRHSKSLAANGYYTEATEYLKRAYDEMMRKYALIPADSVFRDTYLKNIPLHRQIQDAYVVSAMRIEIPTPEIKGLEEP